MDKYPSQLVSESYRFLVILYDSVADIGGFIYFYKKKI